MRKENWIIGSAIALTVVFTYESHQKSSNNAHNPDATHKAKNILAPDAVKVLNFSPVSDSTLDRLPGKIKSEIMIAQLQTTLEEEIKEGGAMVAVAFYSDSDPEFGKLADMSINGAKISGENVTFIAVNLTKNPELRHLLDTARVPKELKNMPMYPQVLVFVPYLDREGNQHAEAFALAGSDYTPVQISAFFKELGQMKRSVPREDPAPPTYLRT